MNWNLLTLFVLLASMTFFSSCEKEYSFEGGGVVGSTAAFTLGGSPGNCTGFLAGGNYVAAVALGSANVVLVDVNVTETGSYSITTGVVNGISFTSSGEFTSTGTQSITLSGAGTPITGGTFNFPLSAAGSNCEFTITVAAAAPPAAGTINCSGVTANGVYTRNVALSATNTLTVPVNITNAGSYSITTNINGTSFTGSGVVALGAQTITLTGSGTPTNTGVIPGNITFGSSSCAYTIDFLPGVTPPTDFLRCNIDGTARTFNVALQGTLLTVGTGNSIIFNGDESTDANTASLTITLTNPAGTVATGTYNLFSLLTPTVPGCLPSYDDGTDTWGPAASGQPGIFTVNVTEVTATRITGTFSGTLYSQAGTGTDSRTFSIGQFSLPY